MNYFNIRKQYFVYCFFYIAIPQQHFVSYCKWSIGKLRGIVSKLLGVNVSFFIYHRCFTTVFLFTKFDIICILYCTFCSKDLYLCTDFDHCCWRGKRLTYSSQYVSVYRRCNNNSVLSLYDVLILIL